MFSLDEKMPGVLMPEPSWSVIVAAYCCLLDIIQFHETLIYLGYNCFAFYKDLENERFSVSEEFKII